MAHIKEKSKTSTSNKLFFGFLFVILVFYVICLLIPLIWGFYTSLKSPNDWMIDEVWPSFNVTFENYVSAFSLLYVQVGQTYFYMQHLLTNSVVYALGSALMAAFTTCITAYMVAKFDYKFSRIIYAIVVITMTIPIIGALPSTVEMTSKIGLFDKMAGMWIINGAFYNMYFLVFHATFKSVANDYAEAASIDGASNFGILFKIMLPLVKNTIAMVVLLYFIAFWNDYQTPMVFLKSKPTLAYGMYLLSTDPRVPYETVRITGGMMTILPILIIFLFAKNKIMGNLTMGGIKG